MREGSRAHGFLGLVGASLVASQAILLVQTSLLVQASLLVWLEVSERSCITKVSEGLLRNDPQVIPWPPHTWIYM